MMKRVFIAAVCLVASAVMLSTAASAYVENVDVYQYSIGGNINWSHTYDGSADPIASAGLTIVADDIDDGEDDQVYFNGHYLGLLNDMGYYTNWSYHPGPGNPNQPVTVTYFSLDPSWIASGMPVNVTIETSWGAEIETSRLSVSAVPEPSSLLALLCGMGGIGGMVRRRKSS